MSTAFAGPWSSLPTELTPWILDTVSSMGHTRMTPVQASTIPLFMKHKDVVVEAVTGSGKTLAFVIPVLEKLVRRETKLRKHDIGALIVTPTRELATQIHTIFSIFLSSQPDEDEQHPPALLLVSDTQSSPADDLKRFTETNADIIIGTPGRVEEFLLGKGRDVVNVKELEVLVLDEADRLLDLGFQATITRILGHLPKQRRTGLFSATMTDADALSELVRVGLRNPARIVVKVQAKKLQANGSGSRQVVEERRIPANLQNLYIPCKSSEKLVQLLRIIDHEVNVSKSSHFIVYFSTGACVDYFFKILTHLLPSQTSIHSLHGKLPTNVRTKTLSTFSSSVSALDSASILLCTDVAARGLDLPHVDVVIQFDPPTDTKTFSHRCGRTARAGRSGRAWTLLVDREVEYVDFLAVRKIPLNPHAPFPGSAGANMEDAEDLEVEELMARIRSLLLTDRGLSDIAVKAYVSFVQAYTKHEASYIFRLKDYDLIGLGKCYGLLRLPRMPELKGANRDTWKDDPVDWSTYAYLDKAQENKRILALTSAATEAEIEKRKAERAEKKKANIAWSDKEALRLEKEKRKEKKSRKRKWVRQQEAKGAAQAAEGEVDGDAANDEDDDNDDWAELAREERMAKKVKRGDVKQSAFDAEFGDL